MTRINKMTRPTYFLPVTCLLLALFLSLSTAGYAHSGKARFHVIIDTDCAADDLRAICMLLGNREVEVLAITTSEGALAPVQSAVRVAALLNDFYHQGIPVGVGRDLDRPAPEWREHSQQINWGNTSPFDTTSFISAPCLIEKVLQSEEETVVFIALGSLTNLNDLLQSQPSLTDKIERVIWYNDAINPLSGPNYRADTLAAHRILSSNIPMDIVSANVSDPLKITKPMLDSISSIPTRYVRKIVNTHREKPLMQLVDSQHLEGWDDLVVAYLFFPGLFVMQDSMASVVKQYRPESIPWVNTSLLSVLRGKPDTESRVFYGFPVQSALYAEDVAPIIDTAIVRHGISEWRAGVLTNELHGHLGIYATIGVKMGIRAREYFNIGVDDVVITTYAGSTPPVSCLNDGLQVSTGGTVGHGLIHVESTQPPRPEAVFAFKGKSIRLSLKPEYSARIRKDVQKGVDLYGNSEAYWQYIRGLALQYWCDFDRHLIFDMQVE